MEVTAIRTKSSAYTVNTLLRAYCEANGLEHVSITVELRQQPNGEIDRTTVAVVPKGLESTLKAYLVTNQIDIKS